MSVLIKGMEMPDTCFDCPCRDFEFHECSAKEHLSLLKDEYGAEIGDIPNWCPLVELSDGRWIHDGQQHRGGFDWMHCSKCGYTDVFGAKSMYHYCPNCGARMEGEEDDSDKD